MAAGDVALREAGKAEEARVAEIDAGAHRHDILDGPFTTKQLLRIDEALRLAEKSAEPLKFSIYVGPLHEPTVGAARKLHDELPEPDDYVLLAISPEQRKLEIVTGKQAVKRIPDRSAALAALSMTAAFGGGDLAGGVVTGLRMLADQAG